MNPSGRTPSVGAESKRASGAWDNGGASKLGGRYWNRGRLTLADAPAIAERQSYAARPRGGRGRRYRNGARKLGTASRGASSTISTAGRNTPNRDRGSASPKGQKTTRAAAPATMMA